MKNLLVYRQYDFHGIKVIVKIDRIAKTLSIVEHNNSEEYSNKKFEFSGRELNYMNGWLNILSAIKYAINEARKELEKFKDDDSQEFLNMIVAIQDAELHDES